MFRFPDKIQECCAAITFPDRLKILGQRCIIEIINFYNHVTPRGYSTFVGLFHYGAAITFSGLINNIQAGLFKLKQFFLQ
jgi:hypothetical protein